MVIVTMATVQVHYWQHCRHVHLEDGDHDHDRGGGGSFDVMMELGSYNLKGPPCSRPFYHT